MARRQGIFWLLTCPSPNSVVEDSIANEACPIGVVWLHGQLERGDESGYLHYQVLVAFGSKKSLAQVKSCFGRNVHAELSRSEAAESYCHKEDTRVGNVFSIGAKPIRRNSKTDWESVWTAAKSGDLAAIPANIRVVSYRTLRAIQSDFSVPKSIERRVDVFWGSTGTGKSRRAWDEAGEDAYAKCPRSKFWDGYQNQKHVVIDEFRGGIDVSHLLRWFDRYPVRVEIKGSSRPFDAERIWITSNIPVEQWYPLIDEETLAALKRRLNIIHFN